MRFRTLAVFFIVALCGLRPNVAMAVDRSLGADIAKPAAAGIGWSGRAKKRLGRDIEALPAAAPTLRGSHVGLVVIDTRSGQVLFAHNGDDAFVPASTMKLLTGSAALAILGSGYQFHTDAYIAPPNGTLYVRAGGDPLLRTADALLLARAAVAAGGFRYPSVPVIDPSAFDSSPYPPGWSWDDFPYDYAAKLTPIPIDENAMDLTVSPGNRVGAPLEVRQDSTSRIPPVRLSGSAECLDESSVVTPVGTTGAPGTPAAIDTVRNSAGSCTEVVGSLPLGGDAQTISVALREPMAYLSGIIGSARPALHAPPSHDGSSNASIETTRKAFLSAAVPAGARRIWSHDGEPLSDLLADMWWPSDNFVAEMVLRAIGLKHSGMPGTTDHGVDAERVWLKGVGIDPSTVTIADGSGLSTYDRITPNALVTILQADWNGPFRDIVLDDLPLAGVRGTLAKSFIGSLAERRTFAKTGSVSHARSLAGYLAPLRHGTLTFAWSVDDWMGADDDLAALRARVLARLIGD